MGSGAIATHGVVLRVAAFSLYTKLGVACCSKDKADCHLIKAALRP